MGKMQPDNTLGEIMKNKILRAIIIGAVSVWGVAWAVAHMTFGENSNTTASGGQNITCSVVDPVNGPRVLFNDAVPTGYNFLGQVGFNGTLAVVSGTAQ